VENTNKRQKGTVVALAKKLIEGTNKRLANETHVKFAGSSYTPAQVIEKLQAIVNLRQAVDAAKASTKAKLETEKTEMPALRTFTGALVAFIKALYAGQPDALADFGIVPKARTPQTAEAKTAATAKRMATRAARHVMGSKQRKKVKGAVVGVTVTPVTAPALQPTEATPGSPMAHATSGDSTAAPTTPR
jgi:hypothetical protein